MAEVIGLLAIIISILSVYVTVKKNSNDDVKARIERERQTENRLTAVEKQLETMKPVDSRVVALEVKMGLFWNLVEENLGGMLAKANPIQLSVDEEAAAKIYDSYKAKSPTGTLLRLEPAITRELNKQQMPETRYMSHDEIAVFTMVLGAIRAQLFDRGEWKPPEHA